MGPRPGGGAAPPPGRWGLMGVGLGRRGLARVGLLGWGSAGVGLEGELTRAGVGVSWGVVCVGVSPVGGG